jgi:branched-chain amino acid transport system permease protein
MSSSLLLQQLVNALSLGSVYAMIAVGLALIYGVLRILHIAHAGVYAAGAYLGLLFYNLTHQFALALVGAMIVAGLIGVAIERFIYRPMIAKPRIVILIASIGMFICLADLFRILGGPHQLAFSVPELQARYTVGVVEMSRVHLTIIGGTALLFAALWWFLKYTKSGFAIRAVAQDMDAARSFGINVDRSVAMVFFIGSLIAGFGGVMVGILQNAVYTDMGDMIAYKGLALIVIGGFGNVPGAVIAAFVLGLTETFVTTYTELPLSREGIAMLLLVLLILFRPQGLMGRA